MFMPVRALMTADPPSRSMPVTYVCRHQALVDCFCALVAWNLWNRWRRQVAWRAQTTMAKGDGGEAHDAVGEEAEEQERQVGGGAPAGADDLQDRVGRRRFPLDLDGEDAEQQDLHGGSAGIPGTHDRNAGCPATAAVESQRATAAARHEPTPVTAKIKVMDGRTCKLSAQHAPEGSADAVLPGHVGRLQEGGCPRPAIGPSVMSVPWSYRRKPMQVSTLLVALEMSMVLLQAAGLRGADCMDHECKSMTAALVIPPHESRYQGSRSAAHQWDTMSTAISPVRMVRPAQLNCSLDVRVPPNR